MTLVKKYQITQSQMTLFKAYLGTRNPSSELVLAVKQMLEEVEGTAVRDQVPKYPFKNIEKVEKKVEKEPTMETAFARSQQSLKGIPKNEEEWNELGLDLAVVASWCIVAVATVLVVWVLLK